MFPIYSIRGVIFDLDDTLVHTNLDFGKIKSAISCPPDQDILSFVASIPNKLEREHAHSVILAHELDDAHTSVWIKGARDFVIRLQKQGIPCAIVTRNCRQATEIKIKKNSIPIDLIITREDAPAKPDPSALNDINAKWQFASHEVAYIGDYKYDIQAAHKANMQAWLFSHDPHKTDFEDMLQLIEK